MHVLCPSQARVATNETAVSAAARAAGEMANGVRYAGGGKEVKNRMKSVMNIRKITKSMKMVAASRLRGAQTRMELSRPFGASVSQFLEGKITTDESAQDAKGFKHLVIAITSDRGLCGGINGAVVKGTKVTMKADAAKSADTALMILGDKGRPMLQREYGEKIVLSTSELWKQPATYLQAAIIAERVLSRDFDKLTIIYNTFKSVIAFDLTKKSINSSSAIMANLNAFDEYEFEGESEEILRNLFEFNGARMTAMDNATRNAGDMINRLQLDYNRSRQSAITTELIEIISGAESLKG
eukprot:tig00001042_g6589.t1